MTGYLPSRANITDQLPDLRRYESLRDQIHSNPELSGQEEATARIVADHLRSLEVFAVHVKIGGHGVAAVYTNGPGKTLLLRADMDALPLQEKVDVPFASKVHQIDRDGILQPVMHACGHDIHVVGLLAAAETLARMHSTWSGTLVLVFQPAEEQGLGAQAMVDGGLYSRVPIPDVVLFQHVTAQRAGRIGTRAGPILTAADSLKITFFGRGGHGALPDTTIDPIIMAASAIIRLQTIVSREIGPSEEVAVVNVGMIQGGTTESTVPDQVEIGVSIRTINQETRSKVNAAVRRIVKAEADASGAIQEPKVVQIANFPPTENDQDTVKKITPAFRNAFGDEFSDDHPRINASEDFSILATSVDRPYAVWFVGSTAPELYDDAEKRGVLKEIPGNHSPFFAPVIEPTLKTGVTAFCTAALALFGEQKA